MKLFRLSMFGMLVAGLAFTSCQNAASADNQDASTTKVETVNPAENVKASADVITAEPTGPTTVMTFDELEYDFGTVDQGEKVTHTYAFKNEGKEPLILSLIHI